MSKKIRWITETAVLLALLALTVYWTYSPLEIPLFTDSQTGQTGIVNEL